MSVDAAKDRQREAAAAIGGLGKPRNGRDAGTAS
jgi:hypothetical protein